MRIHYRPEMLASTEIFSEDELVQLHQMASSFPLEYLVGNVRWKEESAIDFVFTSAQIEGNQYSLADTIRLLEEGKTAGGHSFRDATMIVNLRAAYDSILVDSARLMQTPEQALCSLHSTLMRGLLPANELGTVRATRGTLIGGSAYIPISGSGRLRSEMDRFMAHVSAMENPFQKSIYAFANLPYLQYFEDGNKRSARAFSNAVLMAAGMPPVLFPAHAKADYLEATVQYYETGDPLLLRAFVLAAYRDAYGESSVPGSAPAPGG